MPQSNKAQCLICCQPRRQHLYLTMRNDLLQQLLGPYNADEVDPNDVVVS